MSQRFFPRPGANRRGLLTPLFNPRRIRYEWRTGGPVITVAILTLCVAVWLVEITTRFLFPALFSAMVGNGAFAPVFFSLRPWSVVTSMFLHSTSIFHILFNMLTLWMVGPVLEKMLGHLPYLVLYVLSGLGGSMGLMLWTRLAPVSWSTLSVSAYGASGAIFGLFAALLLVYQRVGVDIRSMLVMLAVNFVMPVIYPNIAWQAHVGGFIVGGLLTLLLMWRVPGLRKVGLGGRTAIFGGALFVIVIAVMMWCAVGIGAYVSFG